MGPTCDPSSLASSGVMTVVTGTGFELLFPKHKDEDF